MDASQCDVVSDVRQNWNSIDWTKVHRTIRRLQIRIAKAVKDGDWRGVKRLQRLLACSTSGKLLAVRRVTENHGRRTAGVDGVTWPTPACKASAVGSLVSKGYRALPLRRVHIPKNRGEGTRPLGIPTMRGDAGFTPVDSGTDFGKHGGRELLRVSTFQVHSGCSRPMQKCVGPKALVSMDFRGRYQRVF